MLALNKSYGIFDTRIRLQSSHKSILKIMFCLEVFFYSQEFIRVCIGFVSKQQ